MGLLSMVVLKARTFQYAGPVRSAEDETRTNFMEQEFHMK